jgi:hypothetical protein
MESPGRWRGLATCATAVGLGAGLITGTAVASADAETTDPPTNGDSTGLVGSTLNTVNDIAKRSPTDLTITKYVDKASVTISARIVTNHSLTSARLV